MYSERLNIYEYGGIALKLNFTLGLNHFDQNDLKTNLCLDKSKII